MLCPAVSLSSPLFDPTRVLTALFRSKATCYGPPSPPPRHQPWGPAAITEPYPQHFVLIFARCNIDNLFPAVGVSRLLLHPPLRNLDVWWKDKGFFSSPEHLDRRFPCCDVRLITLTSKVLDSVGKVSLLTSCGRSFHIFLRQR